uniref:Uncharacterized protein n=1 Tax=Pseudictyota dubia TaxID=2749911 RepID=A0A7R9Z2L8_9STRA|mmetsp:Transcript_19495/g.36520  ORF Transcript_19495/g.36520 Transcript_19495/m.36520 type:complete len:168 (+) Transcript_19495:218-721(+)
MPTVENLATRTDKATGLIHLQPQLKQQYRQIRNDSSFPQILWEEGLNQLVDVAFLSWFRWCIWRQYFVYDSTQTLLTTLPCSIHFWKSIDLFSVKIKSLWSLQIWDSSTHFTLMGEWRSQNGLDNVQRNIAGNTSIVVHGFYFNPFVAETGNSIQLWLHNGAVKNNG